MFFKFICLAFIVILLFAPLQCAGQSGGSYKVEQSVIASGGTTISSGGQFAIGGTIGQPVAGQTTVKAPYSVNAGFWTPQSFAPTVATVNLGGRVLTADGRGIRNVRIILTMPDGITRNVTTSAFGYYNFADIPVGETYILAVGAKKFRFSEATRIITPLEELGNIDFVALPN